MIAGFEPATVGLIMLCFFVGGIVKGVLGFGLPIVTMSTLPYFLPVEQSILLSAFVQPFTNILQLFTSGKVARALALSWPVLVALVPGVVLGAWSLSGFETSTLLVIVGTTIVAFAIYNLVGFRIAIPEERQVPAGLGLGFAAGIFGALTALNSWAFILYLYGVNATRQEFRSSIAAMFLVSGFMISASIWAVGLVSLPEIMVAVIALVASFPGMWIGDRFGQGISADLFRKIVLISLAILGAIMAIRAIS